MSNIQQFYSNFECSSKYENGLSAQNFTCKYRKLRRVTYSGADPGFLAGDDVDSWTGSANPSYFLKFLKYLVN